MPFPVAARSRAQVFGRSPAEIMGSNPTGGMDVCLLCVLCVVKTVRKHAKINRSNRWATSEATIPLAKMKSE